MLREARADVTCRATLAGVVLGDGAAVAVMGALNVSPESFYGGSVATLSDEVVRAADAMARAGAAIIDVGAMSTAPYLTTAISEAEEADRLGRAVRLLTSRLEVPVSADTSRSRPALAALQAGARIVNDVTGLTRDSGLAAVAARSEAGLILMASERGGTADPGPRPQIGLDPVEIVIGQLQESLDRARASGVPDEVIAVDPGIGFWRSMSIAWHAWDVAVLAALDRLGALGRPVCVGVSRKSFIGALTGEADPGRRLPGSLAAAAAAVLRGAHLIRAHDVAETVQAVRVAEAIRRATEPELP